MLIACMASSAVDVINRPRIYSALAAAASTPASSIQLLLGGRHLQERTKDHLWCVRISPSLLIYTRPPQTRLSH